MTITRTNFFKSLLPNAVQIFVLILAVVAAYYIGRLSTEVKFYKEGLSQNNLLAQNPEQAEEPEPYQPIDISTFTMPTEIDHIRGSKDAKIAIVEYSDFDCPFCGTFHNTAKQLVDESNGEIQWIYRHFPLEQLHPNSMEKSIASECAYNLGGDEAFWGFADEFLANYLGEAMSIEDYSSIATKLGIDADQLKDCIKNEETKDRISKDLNEGTKVGVMGTPGNYIANWETSVIIPLRGAEPIENVKNVLEMVKN